MVIFPLAPDQTIAQMWSNGARGGCQWATVHGWNLPQPWSNYDCYWY